MLAVQNVRLGAEARLRPRDCDSARGADAPPNPFEDYLRASPVSHGSYAFRNPRTGSLWGARALTMDFAGLCQRAGVTYSRDVVDGVTLHGCHHTCATDKLRAGVDIAFVADLLGDTMKTIKETYVHLDATDLGRAVAAGPHYGATDSS
jgi:integrase